MGSNWASASGRDEIKAELANRGIEICVLRTDAAADGISYQAGFQPSASHGQIRLPFEAFQATFRGRPVPGAPALRGADVRQLGFMLSRFQDGGSVDGSVAAGAFKLRLASLAAY